MNFIEINGMKFHSFIGHFEEEKKVGNKFNVDIKIKTDCKKSGQSDNLKDAIDYVEIYNVIKDEMQKKCNLVENAAARIKSSIFENFPQAQSIVLKISKLSPKIGGIVDKMSIIIEEERKY